MKELIRVHYIEIYYVNEYKYQLISFIVYLIPQGTLVYALVALHPHAVATNGGSQRRRQRGRAHIPGTMSFTSCPPSSAKRLFLTNPHNLEDEINWMTHIQSSTG